MSQLAPCASCHRHVRSGESCPFCGSGPVLAAPAPAAPPIGRLGRAAILAFGATLGAGALASGCVAAYGTPAPPVDAGADSGAVAPAYGAPAPDGG